MESLTPILRDLTANTDAIYDSHVNVWKCGILDKNNNLVQVGYGKTKEAAEQAAKLIASADDLISALASFMASMNDTEKFPGHNDAYRKQVCAPRAEEAFTKAGQQGYSYK